MKLLSSGGYFDEEFMEATRALFARLEAGEVRFVVSDVLDLELAMAPPHVRTLLESLPVAGLDRVELSDEAFLLADAYIRAQVVGGTSVTDCRHIALATIHRCSVLASWNFKHIVNWDRIRGYNSVNLREGYPVIEIRSPLELT